MDGNSHNGMPDDALVQRSQAGDAMAFGDLYLRYYDRVFGLCLRRLSDRHEAEDAAQETFTRAWKALPQFAGERRFYPWLRVIAQNICTDVARRRSRIRPTQDLGRLTAAQTIDISENVIVASEQEKIASLALKRLSPRHQQVLALREAGLTYQQIAEHEDVGVGAVETLLWRARQALKRQFALLSEGRKAVAWFLLACAAVVRRLTHRLRSHSSSVGGLHGSFAGGVTTAGVAVTFVALPMWSTGTADSSHHRQPEPAPTATSAPRSSRIMVETPATTATQPTPTTTKPTPAPVTSTNTAATASPAVAPPAAAQPAAAPESTPAAAVGAPTTATNQNGAGTAVSGTTNAVGNVVSGATGDVAQIGRGAAQTVSGATGAVTQTVNGVVSGAAQTVSGVVGGVVTTVTPTQTTTTPTTVPGLVNGASQILNGLLKN